MYIEDDFKHVEVICHARL